MKRFLLFGGIDFYAEGGICDLRSTHDTSAEAIEEGKRLVALYDILYSEIPAEDQGTALSWAHVADAETLSIVWAVGIMFSGCHEDAVRRSSV
jgi:hypothetical protein